MGQRMKTTIEIADPLLRRAKAVATEEGLTLRALVEEGLRAALEARGSVVSKPFRLRDGSFAKGAGLQPGVRWTDLSRLAYEDGGRSGHR
jgi:hypothetical protein